MNKNVSHFSAFHTIAQKGRVDKAARQLAHDLYAKMSRTIPDLMHGKEYTLDVRGSYPALAGLLFRDVYAICEESILSAAKDTDLLESDVFIVLHMAIALYLGKAGSGIWSGEALYRMISTLLEEKKKVPQVLLEHFDQRVHELLRKTEEEPLVDNTQPVDTSAEQKPKRKKRRSGVVQAARKKSLRELKEQKRLEDVAKAMRMQRKTAVTYRTVEEIEEMFRLGEQHGFTRDQVASGLQLPGSDIVRMRRAFYNFPVPDTCWQQLLLVFQDENI